MHQILKAIVTLAVNTPECRDLARFFNLKSEIINHASATLGGFRVVGSGYARWEVTVSVSRFCVSRA